MIQKAVAILFLLSGTFLQAQKIDIDSLVRELGKAREDTNKVILYRMLTGTVKNTDPARAIAYGKAGVELGKKLNFDKGIAGCYLNITAAYSDARKLDSALIYIDSAIFWSHRAGDPNRLALAYLNRADFHMQVRNLKQSLIDCDTALRYAEQANNNDRRARILQTIGSVYFIQGVYPQSRDYYDRANALYQQLGNTRMSAIVLNNIGNIHKRTGEHILAEEHFKKAIAIADSLKDLVNLGMYYGNLSDAYTESGRLDLAEQAAARSLAYAIQQKNEMQMGLAYNYYGQIYLKQGKFLQALNSARQALEISKKQNDIENQQTAADMMAEAYMELGDHRNAYQFLTLSKQLNDSLLRQKYDEDIAAMQTSFKVDEKNNEILLLNKDKELQKQQLSKQQVLVVSSIALVVLSFLGIALLISRYRLRQRMKELQIRNQIAADLHDEVGSSLSSIHMLSEMASAKSPELAGQGEVFKKVSSYTRETMDKMGDIVWMIKPTENEGQGLKERMQRFLYEMCGSRNMTCSLEGEDLGKLRLTMQQRRGIYLIFKEAVNNAVKYSGSPSLRVSIQEAGNKVTLLVSDNGKGFDMKNTLKGNGLDNMQNRARELGGRLDIQSAIGKGTTITFTLPVR